jgi:hypothetical protein
VLLLGNESQVIPVAEQRIGGDVLAGMDQDGDGSSPATKRAFDSLGFTESQGNGMRLHFCNSVGLIWTRFWGLGLPIRFALHDPHEVALFVGLVWTPFCGLGLPIRFAALHDSRRFVPFIILPPGRELPIFWLARSLLEQLGPDKDVLLALSS